MNIIDHLSVGVPNIDEACLFYDGLMAALGSQQLAKTDSFAAYGRTAVQFLIMTPNDNKEHTAGNGTHICFIASDEAAVEAFHAFACSNGGNDEGPVGPRPGYPKPDVYTCFVRDPFGNKLEAIYNGFAV